MSETFPHHDPMTVDTKPETLNYPGRHNDKAWEREARSRFSAYKRGQILAYDESEVFGDLDHK